MTWPGLWPGGEDDVDLHPGELEPLAAGDGLVGVVALERAESRPRDVGHDVGEHRHLDHGAVDRRPGGLGDRRDRADVVEVAVGDEDRVDADAELVDRVEDPLGLVARVDDQARGRRRRGAIT